MRLSKKKIDVAMANVLIDPMTLVKKAEIAPFTYYRAIAEKEVKPTTAGKIAKALNVSVEELMEV